tara:strand:- start:968 stop:1165 length:198 start_codon:yes stop_codon:yes gene_type:complete
MAEYSRDMMTPMMKAGGGGEARFRFFFFLPLERETDLLEGWTTERRRRAGSEGQVSRIDGAARRW